MVIPECGTPVNEPGKFGRLIGFRGAPPCQRTGNAALLAETEQCVGAKVPGTGTAICQGDFCWKEGKIGNTRRNAIGLKRNSLEYKYL